MSKTKLLFLLLSVIILTTVLTEESNLRDLTSTEMVSPELSAAVSKCRGVVPKLDSDCSNVKYSGYSCCRATFSNTTYTREECYFLKPEDMKAVEDVFAKRPISSTANENYKSIYNSLYFDVNRYPNSIQKCTHSRIIESLLGLLFLTILAFF